MPVTVRTVADLPGLDLKVVAGEDGLDREVRWVHVSETVDPTPWLRGGELLLTTGLKIDDADDFGPYCHRLADAGLAGVGFGVGIAYDAPPSALLRAADERGLAILEVPVEAPYVAISEAVSDLLAAERDNTISRAFDAHQALTSAALSGGPDAIVARAARLLEGWVLVTDAAGRHSVSAPASAASMLPQLLPDLLRARERGLRASSTVIEGEHTVLIRPLGTPRRLRGLVAAGRTGPITDYDRMVLSGAVSLLSLETERSRTAAGQLRRQRATALEQIIDGQLSDEAVATSLTRWGLDPDAVCVHVFRTSGSRVAAVYEQVVDLFEDADIPGAALARRLEGRGDVVVVTAPDDRTVERLVELTSLRPMVVLGAGDTVRADAIAGAVRAARHAAETAGDEHRQVARTAEFAAFHLLLRSQPRDALDDFTHSVLGELHEQPRAAELISTLRTFLVHNGHWGSASDALGVHRHTLRARIERIEAVTGRSLGSAHHRMEIWLALLATDER